MGKNYTRAEIAKMKRKALRIKKRPHLHHHQPSPTTLSESPKSTQSPLCNNHIASVNSESAENEILQNIQIGFNCTNSPTDSSNDGLDAINPRVLFEELNESSPTSESFSSDAVSSTSTEANDTVSNETFQNNQSPVTTSSASTVSRNRGMNQTSQRPTDEDSEIIISRAIVQRISRFFECTRNNKTKACQSARLAVATAMMDAGDEREDLTGNHITKNQIIKALNIPSATGFRMLNKAHKKCIMIANGDKRGFSMNEKDKRQSKYKIDLIHRWNAWIERQRFCIPMPCKNESVFKRDIFRKFIFFTEFFYSACCF